MIEHQYTTTNQGYVNVCQAMIDNRPIQAYYIRRAKVDLSDDSGWIESDTKKPWEMNLNRFVYRIKPAHAACLINDKLDYVSRLAGSILNVDASLIEDALADLIAFHQNEKGDFMKFREHRGSVSASAATAVEVEPTIDAVRDLVSGIFGVATDSVMNLDAVLYLSERDNRTGWEETYLVTGRLGGNTTEVLGYCDKPLLDSSKKDI